MQDDFSESCPLRLEHLVALFIQFGHGIKHGKDHAFADATPILFPIKVRVGFWNRLDHSMITIYMYKILKVEGD